MKRKKPFEHQVAWLLLFFWIFGLCGLHRIYLGRYISGIIYLLTFGLFMIGQIADIILINELVDNSNKKIGFSGYRPKRLKTYLDSKPLANPVKHAKQKDFANQMAYLLEAARSAGGTLTPAQVAMQTRRSPDFNQRLIDEAIRQGYCDITNDPETGKIRYVFDV